MRTIASLFSFACTVLVAVTCCGQPAAVIDGPTTAAAGDLVVLSGGGSTGDGFRWITPTTVQSIACGDQLQLAFAVGRPGRYDFILIAADTTAAIDYATHTVTVSHPTEPPPPTGPPAEFEAIRVQSASLADRINDPETRSALAAAIFAVDAQIGSQCDSGTCPGLAVAQAQFVAAIESVLAGRQGSSRNANWLDGWRRPMDAAIKQINPADVPTYRLVMRANATGLKQ